jgi:quercetin dioxygenase-like cupin family protein
MQHFISLETLAEKEIFPGFHGRLIHTDKVSIGHFRIDKGSILPEHSHPHEQVTNVLSGELEFTVDNETRVCRGGDVIVIPSHAPHSARALNDCVVLDVFQPTRDDYR